MNQATFDTTGFVIEILFQRKFKKQSLRAAAADIGISPATLSRIENHKKPDIDSFYMICKWLGREDFFSFFINKNSNMIEFNKEEKIATALLGTGSVAITTIANPNTLKNFGVILNNQGIGEIGTGESTVPIGVDATELQRPMIRLEFYSPKSVIVLINQLNKVLMDMQD